MFSTTKTVTRTTKVQGEIPPSDLLKAIRSLYNLPVDGTVKVTVSVPYEEYDLEDCRLLIEWVEAEEEEIAFEV